MKFRILMALTLLPGCATSVQQNLSDSDIAMIMRVANIGEVREGEVARTKATNTGVRDFATMMVTEHTSQNNKAESELSRADVASSDTTLSRELDAASGAAADRLRPLSGAAFDRAYIERQVDAHQSLLSMIDTKLMPSAKKKAVKEQLTELRKLLDKHLARARQIQGSLPRLQAESLRRRPGRCTSAAWWPPSARGCSHVRREGGGWCGSKISTPLESFPDRPKKSSGLCGDTVWSGTARACVNPSAHISTRRPWRSFAPWDSFTNARAAAPTSNAPHRHLWAVSRSIRELVAMACRRAASRMRSVSVRLTLSSHSTTSWWATLKNILRDRPATSS